MVLGQGNLGHQVLVVRLRLEVRIALLDTAECGDALLHLGAGHVLAPCRYDVDERLVFVRVVPLDALGELSQLVEPVRQLDVDVGLRRVDCLLEAYRRVLGRNYRRKRDQHDADDGSQCNQYRFHCRFFL